jgi:hypothetical protein
MAVGFCGGSPRDALDYRESMLRRKMAVACRHDIGLVSRKFLDLFDRGSGHRQPGARGVPIRMPDIPFDTGILKNGMAQLGNCPLVICYGRSRGPQDFREHRRCRDRVQ